VRVAVMLLVALSLSCRSKAPSEAAPARADDEVRPAFDGQPKRLDPQALTLCDALHRAPAEQRATCCHGAPRVHFREECARVLSLALEAKTLHLRGVDACVAALERTYQGCGWVGPNEPPLPAACATTVVGELREAAKCHSTLECQPGLHCRGAGPTSGGSCQRPSSSGAACELSVDVLASYARITLGRHVECEGFCQRHRCEAVVRDEGSCTLDAQCRSGQRCAGACVEGERGAAGEACVPGGCGEGLRCVAGTCQAPRVEGEPCTAELECLGACGGAADGGRRCTIGC
jgi:hypothetical protein